MIKTVEYNFNKTDLKEDETIFELFRKLKHVENLLSPKCYQDVSALITLKRLKIQGTSFDTELGDKFNRNLIKHVLGLLNLDYKIHLGEIILK